MYENDKQEQVCVTMTVEQWAHVVVAVGASPLDLFTKEKLNSTIYECVRHTERALS